MRIRGHNTASVLVHHTIGAICKKIDTYIQKIDRMGAVYEAYHLLHWITLATPKVLSQLSAHQVNLMYQKCVPKHHKLPHNSPRLAVGRWLAQQTKLEMAKRYA